MCNHSKDKGEEETNYKNLIVSSFFHTKNTPILIENLNLLRTGLSLNKNHDLIL